MKNPLIYDNRDALEQVCRQYYVSKLYLFGSALTEKFSDDSDVDFLVIFQENIDLAYYADNYFDFTDSLEKIFGRKIDLQKDKAIKNPYFRRAVDATKQLVYG